MIRTEMFLASICSLSLYSSYCSAHFDFTPRVEGGRVVVGGYDDELGQSVASLRVGGYDFGEIADDPYNIADPGFNTLGASAFTGGSALRLRAASAGGAYLRYWNGTGVPAFVPADAGTTVTLSASPSRSITFSATTASVAPTASVDLQIGTFAANGAMHVHLGASVAASTAIVPVGAYLIAFDLTNPGTGVATSELSYIVYNNGLTETQHDAAIDAVAAAYVPEPATAALLTGVLAIMRRRRRGPQTAAAGS